MTPEFWNLTLKSFNSWTNSLCSGDYVFPSEPLSLPVRPGLSVSWQKERSAAGVWVAQREQGRRRWCSRGGSPAPWSPAWPSSSRTGMLRSSRMLRWRCPFPGILRRKKIFERQDIILSGKVLDYFLFFLAHFPICSLSVLKWDPRNNPKIARQSHMSCGRDWRGIQSSESLVELGFLCRHFSFL